MSATVARGLRGILTACCVSESPVPFMCSKKEFQDGDKTFVFKIIDGVGQRTVKQNKNKKKDNENTNKNEEEEAQDENQNANNEDENQGKLQDQLSTMNALITNNDKNEEEKETKKKEEEEKNEKLESKTEEEEEKVEQKNDDNNEEIDEQSNEEEEEEKEPEFDYTFDVNDRTVEGEEDTEFKEDIMTICEYIRNSVSTLYDSQVVAFQASFGAKNEGHQIWLLNSDVSTTPNGFSQNLFRSVPGGEIEFIDFLIDQLSEDNMSRNNPSNNKKKKCPQKTANNQQNSRPTSSQSSRSNEGENESNQKNQKRRRAATSFSFDQKNSNNEYSDKCAEYDHNLATKNWHYCYSGFPTCLNAHYRVPRIFVILYRAHQAFPKVNEARLYRTIEQRLEAIDENASKQMVSVCIQCVHLYTAEEKTYQGQKLTNNMPKDVPSHPFASLVPAELSIKGLRDVGSTPDMYRPFCYKINCRDSPYRDPALKVKKPPDPPDKNPTPQIPKAEKWVKRLTNPYRSHSVKSSERKKMNLRSYQKKDQNVNEEFEAKLPSIYQSTQSYSERLAPDAYSSLPFGYSFLGKVKKKNEMLKKRNQRLNSKVKNE